MSSNLIITGCGTEVGKTVTAMIFAEILLADYWKPVEGGKELDSTVAQFFLGVDRVHPSSYQFSHELSPHHAARLEKTYIDPSFIHLPQTKRPLVIETAGGLMVPWTNELTAFDFFSSLQAKWIVVSKHYLGSINHTLLTIDALQKKGCEIAGIIFNGVPNFDSEKAILTIGKVKKIGTLLPEKTIDRRTLQYYVDKWKFFFKTR